MKTYVTGNTEVYRKQRDLKRRFLFFLAGYVVVMVVFVANYSLRSNITVGVIIGGIFPFMSFLYLQKHYVAEDAKVNIEALGNLSFMGWILPTFFLHLVIIFAFVITFQGPKDYGFHNSLYSSFYSYSKVFDQFQKYVEERGGETETNSQSMFYSLDYYAANFKSQPVGGRPTRFETLMTWLYNQTQWPILEFFAEKQKIIEPPAVAGNIAQWTEVSHKIRKIPFFMALAFSFLGALIFSLIDVANRYNNSDLYPKVYVLYIVRFIASVSLAVASAGIVMSKFSSLLAPLVFFCLGYFPERAIKYLDDKMNQHLGFKPTDYRPLPLTMIQGMSPENALRLREIGVMDLQHLALANIDELNKNLPYNLDLISDWKDQAVMFLQFPEQVEELRKMGIRTMLQLVEFDVSQGCLGGKNGILPNRS